MSLRSLVPPIVLVLIGPSIVSALQMDSPGPIAECTEATFTWQGDRPPYTLTITTADSSDTVFSADTADTTIQWLAAVAAGTELIATLSDTPLSGRSRDGSIVNSFVIQPGSDSCLGAASPSSSISIVQPTTDSHTSASPPSTSREQSKTSGTTSPQSPTTSASTSTTQASTAPRTGSSPSSTSSGAPSQSQPLPGSGTTAPESTESTGSTGSTGGRPGPGGFSSSTTPQPPGTSSTQPSRSPDPDPRAPGRRSGSGTIAGAVVGALLAGVVLAAGLLCLWRARRRRKASERSRARMTRDTGHGSTGRRLAELHGCPYPTEDAARPRPATMASSTTPSQSPPGYDDHFHTLAPGTDCHHYNADPVNQDMSGKARQDGFTRDGGQGSEGTGNPVTVRRRWEMDDPAPSEVFDDARSSELSGSTEPPPYSQIDFEF